MQTLTDVKRNGILASFGAGDASAVGAIGFDGNTEVRWVRVAVVMLPR